MTVKHTNADIEIQGVRALRALSKTLAGLRPLRNTLLAADGESRAALALAHVGLLLERIQHGIPVSEGGLRSILTAAEFMSQEEG